MKTVILILLSTALFYACNTTDSATGFDDYLEQGDSISNAVQGVLLSNVARAMSEGGTPAAIAFCSERAAMLTSGGAEAYTIKRLSDKNRNPHNAIATAADSAAWEKLKTILADTSIDTKHFVMQAADNKIQYYKAITIKMPACLKCHGDRATEIDSAAYTAIADLYPGDKAIGYRMNDLRGMWKISFEQK